MKQKVKIFKGIVFLVLLFSLKNLCAQDSLDIYLDYSAFFENEEYSFVEVYYSFSRASVDHIKDGQNYTAQYSTRLNIYSGDSLVKSIDNKIADKIDSLEVITQGMLISDVYPLLLKNGRFKITFSLMDLNTKSLRQKSVNFDLFAPNESPYFLSDIQLALDIKHVSKKSRFVKNGYQVTPNPARIYGVKSPILFYYCEVYSVAANDSLDSCRLISEIVDLEENQVKKISAKDISIKNNGIVEIDKTLVGALNSGSYYLKISLTDTNNNVYDSKKKLFYVFRQADFVKPQSVSVASQDDLLQIYQTMTEEQLDKEFKQAEFIAQENEIDIFEDLDLAAKRKFLVEFWKRREHTDPDGNNIRTEYMQRVEYANNRFSSASVEGWETDRGRIILTYGLPDDFERFFGGSENIQYEIWTYNNLEGGAQFVFVDISRYGRYRLVHSTMLNEIKDYEWRNRYLK